MKSKILNMLKETETEYVSGEMISKQLGISRAAIWKYINVLKEEGYIIESSSRKGYKRSSSPDVLSSPEIMPLLMTKSIGLNILHFDTINSSNIKAKELASSGEQDGTIVISEEQTAGRGRLGRAWISPKYKGIWMSIILKPTIDPIYASRVTLIAASAVFNAMKDLEIPALIKWPNDIVLNNKKVCGILTEMSAELNRIHYLIIGIGINVNTEEDEFPKEIRDIATSLKTETNKHIDRKALLSRIINHLEPLYDEFINSNSIAASVDICRKNSIFLGKYVRILKAGKEYTVKALDLNDEGQLIVEHGDGTIETIFSGEVSLRGLYGYI
jgi:BirA family transcriptional regulator, biotin operon repressor / biotin---[acetyl-CoA-carboxylase] ligase